MPATHLQSRSPGQRAVLGHAISTLLDCGAPEKEHGVTNRGLRTTALSTLSMLLDCLPDAGALAAFLPGVSSAAMRIMLGDYKQGQAIFVLAITLWTAVVSRVMNDRRLASAACADVGPDPGADGGGGDDDGRSLSVAQDAEWKTTTAGNLKAHLDKLTGVVNHSSWKVRLEYVGLAAALMRRCSRTLLFSIPVLIELLVELSNDEYDAVASAAKLALGSYSAINAAATTVGPEAAENDLVLLCRENVLSLLLSLPRVIRGESDDDIFRSLNLLAGYLSILGPETKKLLASARNTKRFSTFLARG